MPGRPCPEGPVLRCFRHAVAALVLLGYVLSVTGYPLPRTVTRKGRDYPFTCQNRPCGCVTAEECWRGDCCCFTLEQKLAWADQQGIEPPDHVRPTVRARQQHQGQPSSNACC